MTYQVVIPMTGVGQRFVNAGYSALKPLIQVGGKPMIEHVLDMFAGAQRIICIVSKDHEQRATLVAEIYRVRPDAIVKDIEKHKFGPGYAILQAKEEIDPSLPTLVSYCDWAGQWETDLMINQLQHYSGSILTYTGFHPHMTRSTKFAYVQKSEGLVSHIQEKQPYTDNPFEEEASAGCYGFSAGSLMIEALEWQIKAKEDLNGEFYLSLTYRGLLRKGLKIGTVVMEKFFQWGTPEDLHDWEYWFRSVKQLPGVIEAEVQSHNVILAAGRGSRLSRISDISKPNISVKGRHLWEYSAPRGVQFRSNTIVTRSEVKIITRADVVKVILPDVTDGQAISAQIGILSIENPGNYPLNVLSSDNAFNPDVFRLIGSQQMSNELIIWTSKGYPPSLTDAIQYSWINLETKTVLKKCAPPNFLDWEMLIGNFTFSNCELALSLINELVITEARVNGEFYLDSLIDIAFVRGIKVRTMQIKDFIAIGTPNELLTFQYFSSLPFKEENHPV
jgi:NDP-sugar pyrophosphorylase family protein